MSRLFIRNYTGSAALFLALLITAGIYFPGLSGPFVFDDLSNILLRPDIRLTTLDTESVQKAVLSRMDAPPGRPMAMLSFALNYYFAGFDVFYFKATNLAIHLLCGLSLYYLTCVLLRRYVRTRPDSWLREEQVSHFALLVTTAWLFHPLNLTSVLYVVQRMTSLAALFTILGLLAYSFGREQIIAGRKSGFIVIGVGLPLSFVLATLSKENGVLIPLFALLIEVVFYRLKAHPQLASLFRRFFAIFLIFPLILALAVTLYHFPQLIHADAYTTRPFTLEQRLLTEARVIWFYLRLIVLPDTLSMSLYHDNFGLSTDLFHPVSTPFAVAGLILILFGSALLGYRSYPVAGFGLLWFFLGHSMESTVIPLELVHEHRNYLPQFGILLALLYSVGGLISHRDSPKKLRLAFVSSYLIFLAGSTYVRADMWRNEEQLYTGEVRLNPTSSQAHTMLAVWLHQHGQFDAALFYFEKAADLDKSDSTGIIRLANHLVKVTGEIPETVLATLAARLVSNPYSPVTLWSLNLLIKDSEANRDLHGRLLAMYETLISRNDVVLSREWLEDSLYRVATGYLKRKDYAKALEYFTRTIGVNPDAGNAYLSAAEIYLLQNHREKADKLMRKLAERNLDLPEVGQKRRSAIIAQLK